MEALEGDWAALLRALRPGSRTILWQPPGYELCLAFARRGFRLMLLHREANFNVECRSLLRESGLASQLMGSQVCSLNEVPSLAKDFYDIFLFCRQAQFEGRNISYCLSKGSLVVAPAIGFTCWSEDLEMKKVERLPPTFVGFRV